MTRVCAGAIVLTIAFGANRQPAPPATVDDALKLAAAYLDRYERRIGGIVAEEQYLQTLVPMMSSRNATGTATQARKTRAYIMTLRLGDLGWVTFRDVFEIDGRAVRGREERLSRILQNVTRDSLAQARQIASESARYNLSPTTARVDRTINVPMAALLYLRGANQARSAFRLGKPERIDGVNCLTLTFNEQARPRLIHTNDDAPARGTFWIDAAGDGRVVRTELKIDSMAGRDQPIRTQITVVYARVEKLDLWLPTLMNETHDITPSVQLLTGRATYSDFREATVTTSETIK